jgi:hypothetical protein
MDERWKPDRRVRGARRDGALVGRLKELDVRRLLLQPFKLRDVIHTLEQLWPVQELLTA